MPDPTAKPDDSSTDVSVTKAPAPTSGPTVKVRVRWPHSSFESGVDGVPTITREPIEIPAASFEAVQKVARINRVPIELVKE